MKKTWLILLLAALLLPLIPVHAEFLLPEALTAIEDTAFEGDTGLLGLVTLPDAVRTVGKRAFAGTSLHALILPEGCTNVDGSVLEDTEAAYLHLKGPSTAISGAPADVGYVFGPAFGSASSLDNFYAAETLVEEGFFYYSVTEGSATPLCAVDGSKVNGVITMPKLVEGQPVRSLETLLLNGCSGLTELWVPEYLEIPAALEVSAYQTMNVTEPVPSADSAAIGDSITWTTSVTGAYGQTSYVWSFSVGDKQETVITDKPSAKHTIAAEGTYTVTVTVTDEVGDSAHAVMDSFSVGAAQPVYRALLVCNTYPGTTLELPGSDNDVAGMRTMLGKMTATPYRISTQRNLSADGIVTAIQNTFADATANDVSLFYFSGHGTNAVGTTFHGALMGTGPSYLTAIRLRNVLDEIPGKKVVIVDSCHSGQLIGRSGEPTPVTTAELNAFNSHVIGAFATTARSDTDLAASSYYVITAAHSTEETANTGHDANGDTLPDKEFSVFTYSLCYGSGWNMATNVARALSADVDENNEITLYEAFAYARNKAQQTNPYQTAQVYPANSTLVIWAK